MTFVTIIGSFNHMLSASSGTKSAYLNGLRSDDEILVNDHICLLAVARASPGHG